MFLQTSWFLHFSNNVPFIALTVDAKSAHGPRVNHSRGNLTLNSCSHLARFYTLIFGYGEALNGVFVPITCRSESLKEVKCMEKRMMEVDHCEVEYCPGAAVGGLLYLCFAITNRS